jgi:hypothetical protein
MPAINPDVADRANAEIVWLAADYPSLHSYACSITLPVSIVTPCQAAKE